MIRSTVTENVTELDSAAVALVSGGSLLKRGPVLRYQSQGANTAGASTGASVNPAHLFFFGATANTSPGGQVAILTPPSKKLR